MLGSLTGRVSSLVQLARAQDWTALNARLLNQSDHTDDVVAVLITQVDADLETPQTSCRRSGRSAVAGRTDSCDCDCSEPCDCGVAGAWITRSITQPLSTLGRGARALAAGDFQYRAPIDGTDELAHVAQVFNSTAAELAGMFDEVQTQRAAAEAAQAMPSRNVPGNSGEPMPTCSSLRIRPAMIFRNRCGSWRSIVSFCREGMQDSSMNGLMNISSTYTEPLIRWHNW